MEIVHTLNGGQPWIVKLQVSATVANGQRGVPVRGGTTSGSGIRLITENSAADVVGLAIDNATYTTTQGSGADSAERLVSVIINPDAVYRARLSGGGTEGTALSLHTVTTASSGGTAVTTATSWSDYEGGTVWGYQGANAGQVRKLTSVSSTAGTVTVPFDYATVVGDTFLRAPFYPFSITQTVNLTDAFYEVDTTVAAMTGGDWAVIDLELNDISNDGLNNSYVHMIPNDHFLNREG